MNKRCGRPRIEGKKKVGLSLDESLLERLKAKASNEGRSISGAVDIAIKEWLKEKCDV